MQQVFWIAAVASLAPAYAAWHTSKHSHGPAKRLLHGLAATHLMNAIILAFWATTKVPLTEHAIFTNLIIGLQTALLGGTLAITLKQQRFGWLLIAYMLSIPLIYTNITAGLTVVGILSGIIMIIFGSVTIFTQENKAGVAAISAGAAIILQTIIGTNTIALAFASSAASIAIAMIYVNLEEKFARTSEIPRQKSNLRTAIKFIVFVPTITIFLLGVTIAIHEYGHGITATLLGCEYGDAVIYGQTLGPHANVQCENPNARMLVGIAGTLIPLIIALLFVLLDQELTTIVSIYMAGYSFVFFYGDAAILGLPITASFTASVLGFMLLLFGVTKLSVSFLKT